MGMAMDDDLIIGLDFFNHFFKHDFSSLYSERNSGTAVLYHFFLLRARKGRKSD